MAALYTNTTPQTDPINHIVGFRTDAQGHYQAERLLSADEIIEAGRKLMLERFNKRAANTVISANIAKELVVSLLEGKEHEVFMVLFLNNQHHLIEAEEMFRGTINGASVYPREVLKRAVQLNAAAVIFAHNHPSGIAEPSLADIQITKRLREVLDCVDVRAVDHIIVGAGQTVSLSETGKM